MKKRKKRAIVRWIIIIMLILIWFSINPPLRFGVHCFGITVYSGVPFPVGDVTVYANGLAWFRSTKSREITNDEIRRLLGTKEDAFPDVIVIGTGYEGDVKVAGDVLIEFRIAIEAHETPEAIKRFNELRSQGKRVAAIIHSI